MRIRTPSPATAIATAALFVALGGTSYAAITVTGANVKNGSLTGKDVKDDSLASPDVKNGSLEGKDFKAGQLPAGAAGAPGAKGDTGAAGGPGAAGAKGDAGATGTAGATGGAGPKGDTGAPGPKGDAGEKGADGTDGAPGTPGTNGTDGTDGETGPRGPSNAYQAGDATSMASGSPVSKDVPAGSYLVTASAGHYAPQEPSVSTACYIFAGGTQKAIVFGHLSTDHPQESVSATTLVTLAAAGTITWSCNTTGYSAGYFTLNAVRVETVE